MNSSPLPLLCPPLPARSAPWCDRRFVIATTCLLLAALRPSPALATLGNYQTAVTNEASILAYYTFDQNDAQDARSAHPGSLQGTTTFSAGVSGAGRGLALEGLGRVNLGTVPDFDFADSSGTVEGWVRPGWSSTFTAYDPCIFADRNGGPVTWSVHMNRDKSGIGMWNGGAYRTMGIPNPGTNWHHLAVVFDGGYMTIYWDGAALATTLQILGSAPSSTQIGSSAGGSTSEGWLGGLDEVAFYADALTPEAVQAHYQAFFLGTPPVIVTQPRGGTFLPGIPIQLAVKATGPSLAYQWYKDTTPLTGKTDSVLTFPTLAAGDAGTYSVTITNPAGNVLSTAVSVALVSTLPDALVHYQAAVSNEASLMSYYTFDRWAAKDMKDVNDGTLAGSATFGPGLGGGAAQSLLLDGTGQVNFGTVPAFDFAGGTGTLEGWIRADWTSVSGYPCMFADRDGGLTAWSMHLSGDKQGLTFFNGSVSALFALPHTADTNWHHVAAVIDAGSVTYYWDGLAIGTQTVAPSTLSVSVQFGSSAASSTAEGWIGSLDEVALYSSALPTASIQTHFAAYYQGVAPTISVQPVGGNWLVGQPGQLSVLASGVQLTYQWYKNETAMTGFTNAVLANPNLTAADSGSYYVRVSSPYGSTNSLTAVVQVGNNIAAYQASVLAEPNLISYYPFDAGNAQDAKGTNQGVLAGSAGFGSGAGAVTNQALILDGNGHVDLGQVTSFEFTNGTGTVEAWLRADWNTIAYAPCLFADRDGASVWSIHMVQAKNSIGNWNGDHFQTLSLINPGGWHHYAIAFGGGTVTMYWDGQSLGTFPQAIDLASDRSTQIGSSAPNTTAEGWLGGIDEVAFYDATLSPEAIARHFLAMVGPPPAPKLSYQLAGAQLKLSWPAEAAGFTLESTDKLPATAWEPVGGVVNNQVTVSVGPGLRLYRLKK